MGDLQQVNLRLEWCYKTGGTKTQQFWVYCEESQYNYLTFVIHFPQFTLSRDNGLFSHIGDASMLIFIEDSSSLKKNGSTVKGFVMDSSSGKNLGYWASFNPEHLVRISPSDILPNVQLKQDITYPVHPLQGRVSEVKITKELCSSNKIPVP